VASLSGLGGVEAAEFVSPAKVANGKVRKGTVSAMAASIFIFFMVNFSLMTSIIHQSSKIPSKIFSGDLQRAGVRQIQSPGGAMKHRPKMKRN
jgi:hypothetical protein